LRGNIKEILEFSMFKLPIKRSSRDKTLRGFGVSMLKPPNMRGSWKSSGVYCVWRHRLHSHMQCARYRHT